MNSINYGKSMLSFQFWIRETINIEIYFKKDSIQMDLKPLIQKNLLKF